MITKRHVVIAALLTFCLTVTLFMIIPTRSQTSDPEYDPWVDLNDDGEINILDLVKVAIAFGTNGEPINKTAMLLDLQNRVNALEEKQDYVKTVRFYTSNETFKDQGVGSVIAATFFWTPNNTTNNAILQCYCYFKYISPNDGMTFSVYINGTNVLYDTAPGASGYRQSFLFTSPMHWIEPDKSTYMIIFRLEGTEATAKYVKDINIMLTVMDGLPPS